MVDSLTVGTALARQFPAIHNSDLQLHYSSVHPHVSLTYVATVLFPGYPPRWERRESENKAKPSVVSTQFPVPISVQLQPATFSPSTVQLQPHSQHPSNSSPFIVRFQISVQFQPNCSPIPNITQFQISAQLQSRFLPIPNPILVQIQPNSWPNCSPISVQMKSWQAHRFLTELKSWQIAKHVHNKSLHHKIVTIMWLSCDCILLLWAQPSLFFPLHVSYFCTASSKWQIQVLIEWARLAATAIHW